jgi:hypothetical protein
MGKRYDNLVKDLDLTKLNTLEDAAGVVKKCATAKFDETVELHVRLGVDPKQADQQVRGTVGLPNGLGKSSSAATSRRTPRRPAPTSSATPTSWTRSRRASPTSRCSSRPRT